MINIVFKLLLMILIILIIVSIININKYNNNSELIKLDSFSNISKSKRFLDPLLFNDLNFEFDKDIITLNLDNYYEENNKLIRLDDFKNKDVNIFENNKLITDFNINYICNNLYNIFSGYLFYNSKYLGSLLQDSYKSKVIKNNNNLLLVGNLFGNCNILLINPKHKNDIKNKDNIKKWSIIVNLKKNELLYIPTNWYYLIEVIELTFLFHVKSDSLFTFIYNKYR
jgi:hypothetical protein